MADNGSSPVLNEYEAATRTIDQGVRDALAGRGKAPKEYQCENGVIIGLRPVSRALVAEAINKHNKNKPKPPVIMDEERQREIINDMDPSYLDALEEHNLTIARVSTSVYLGLGTYLKSSQQDLDEAGVEGPDSDGWVNAIKEFMPELDIPAVGSRSRYIAWLQFYCLSNNDATVIQGYLMGYYGQTREEAVAEAMESFPSDVRRDSDNGSGVATEPLPSQN